MEPLNGNVFLEDEACWRAIENRDTSSVGRFVYAVRSTGIYCRPTCPSRRPRRAQVVFFQTAGQAEAAGFRACRRCQPGLEGDGQPPDAQAALVAQACQILERESPAPVLAELARELAVSASYLHHVFKKLTGLTPRQYAAARRMEVFKTLVRAGEALTGAAYTAGFGSPSRVYATAPATLGMTPGEYRDGGLGMTIRYVIVPTPFGRLLAAAAARGLCAVYMGDDDTRLEENLRQEYPAAEVRRAPSEPEENSNPSAASAADLLGAWVEAITRHLQGSLPRLDLPLDLQATAFQLRVWEELRRIPYGETRSYGEVARAIGQPGAARAVARACAANPAALVTPCHRVVRGDGQPGGYRWGSRRKQALLEQENALRNTAANDR